MLLACVSGQVIFLCVVEKYLSGVSPTRDESLLFRQKEPKLFSPVRGPRLCGGRLYGSLRLRPESRWRENSLRSNSSRRKVASGVRLRRTQRGWTAGQKNL